MSCFAHVTFSSEGWCRINVKSDVEVVKTANTGFKVPKYNTAINAVAPSYNRDLACTANHRRDDEHDSGITMKMEANLFEQNVKKEMTVKG